MGVKLKKKKVCIENLLVLIKTTKAIIYILKIWRRDYLKFVEPVKKAVKNLFFKGSLNEECKKAK